MPIPQVRVTTKQVIARPVQASGLTGLILIQAERGPAEPILVANMTEFMQKYTLTGEIPSSATNRSAYYSAQNFLRNSDRLWVRRVVPSDALYAVSVFQQEGAPVEVVIDGVEVIVNPSTNTIGGIGNQVGATGDRVTVYGSDVPAGIVNGGQYYLRQTYNGTDYAISFYDTEAHALAGGSTGLLDITGVGSGSIYILSSESPEASGLDDPTGSVVISPQALMIYSIDQGEWGNNIRVTIEVPRSDETGIHCADAVDVVAGSFPIGIPWIQSTHPGLPVHVIPVGAASVLPTVNGGNDLEGNTTYYAISSDSGSRMKLAETLADAIALSAYAYNEIDGSKGSGSMLVALIGTIAEVDTDSGDVTIEPNATFKTEYPGTATDVTIPCDSTPIPCVAYGSGLPVPLVQGTVYWAYRAGADANRVRLAETEEDAISGNGIEVTVAPTAAFYLMFFTTEQVVARATGVSDCLSDTFDTATDVVDDGTPDTIDVGSLYAELVVDDPIFFTLVDEESPDLPSPLVANTLYYVKSKESGTTISITDAVGNAALGLTDGSGGLATVHMAKSSYIVSDQRLATGTPVRFSIPEGGGLPILRGGETALVAGTTYYVIDATISTEFRIKLARSRNDARDGVEVNFVGNAAATAADFNVSPINVYESWDESYDVIDLNGAVFFGGIGNTDPDTTIQLPLHGSSYQGWVPGEAVRVYPTGSSVLPYGLSVSTTYFVLPIGEGKVQLCTRSGSVLETADQLIPVKLSRDSERKGTGTFSVVPAYEPLANGTFRIKIWKRSEQTSSVGGQASYATTLEETYVCSLYSNLQDSAGRNLEISLKLGSSKYIRGVGVDPESNPSLKVKAVPFLTPLAGGYSGLSNGLISSTELINALTEFTDPVQYSLSYLMDGGYTYPDYQIALVSLAESRGDCIAVLSTPVELEIDSNPARSIIEYVQNNLPSSSFGAIYTPWQLMTQNGVDILVPPDGFVAAQMSKVDTNKGPWYAAAGLEDGAINSRGGSISFSQANLDELYSSRINPIIRVPDAGPTIWGNITLLSVQSPLSRINVRKLMNKVQSELRKSLLQFVMAPIDVMTYTRITNLVEGYLGSIQSKRGIESFMVTCDESNNTAEDRDAQTINVWIYIKPTQVAEFVELTTVVTPSSVSFSTIGVE